MSHATVWEAVLKTALVGTERATLDTSGAGEELSQALSFSDVEAESAVLSAAATMSLYNRAGRISPQSETAPPEVAPPHEKPRPSEAAVSRLRTLLTSNGEERALLPEWLQLAAQNGWRAPEELLPDLLELARGNKEMRPQIAPLLDTRGRWLANLNPDWNFAQGGDDLDDATWHEGAHAARVAFLRRLRDVDAERARTLLLEAWPKEGASARAELLRACEVNLSQSDEEMLEARLDDKSKGVREVAAELLGRLPESRLVARMWERLRPMVRLDTERKGRSAASKRVYATVPTEWDASWERDGLQEKPPASNIGRKHWWLRQLVERVPPAFWEREWNAAPIDILQAGASGEWRDALCSGWTSACVRFGAVEWLEALLQTSLLPESFATPGVLRALPPPRREALCLEAIHDYGRKEGSDFTDAIRAPYVRTLIAACEGVWSVEFSRGLLEYARAVFATPPQNSNYWLVYTLRDWAFHISPALADEAAQNWPENPNASPPNASEIAQRRESLDKMIEMLHRRAEMRRELQPETL